MNGNDKRGIFIPVMYRYSRGHLWTTIFFVCHIKLNVLYLQSVLYGQYGQCTKYVLCSSTTQYWGVVHRCVGISEHAITTKLHQPLRYFHSFRNFYLLHHQQLLPCATSRKGADYVPADLGDSMVLKFRSHASGLFALSKDIRYPTVIEVREWDQICVAPATCCPRKQIF